MDGFMGSAYALNIFRKRARCMPKVEKIDTNRMTGFKLQKWTSHTVHNQEISGSSKSIPVR